MTNPPPASPQSQDDRPRVPPHRANLLFSFVMSVLMSVFMTGVITAINTGFGGAYLARWGKAFLLGFPLAFLCILVLAAPVRRLVNHLVRIT